MLSGDGSELRELLEVRETHAPSGPLAELPIGDIPKHEARAVFPSLSRAGCVYDVGLYYRRAPNYESTLKSPEHPGGRWSMRTNSAGFREDAELPHDPDARIVVIGDSHTDGVCENSDSFANQLERMLAERRPGKVVDVVNAGAGGYSFYNYLRGLDVFARELEPAVYVCAVYGGNDFLEILSPLHYFERTRLPAGGRSYAELVAKVRQVIGGEEGEAFLAQELQQLAFLAARPAEAERATKAAQQITRAMVERARALGIALVFVYIPPPWDVQLERYTEDPEALRRELGLDELARARDANALAEPWMALVRELGAPLVDLREPFRSAPEELYWHFDHHVNLRGHRAIAEALLPVVEKLLP